METKGIDDIKKKKYIFHVDVNKTIILHDTIQKRSKHDFV